MASSVLYRNLYVLDNESVRSVNRSNQIYPLTVLDQVIDQNTPDSKTLRVILEELHQEIVNGGIGAIVFPVTSVNGKQGDVQITKYDLGLDNVSNVPDEEKPLSEPQREAMEKLLKQYKPEVDLSELHDHILNLNNPHSVTFEQVNSNHEVENMIESYIDNHSLDEESHPDIRYELLSIQDKNDEKYNEIDEKINDMNKLLEEHQGSVYAHELIFRSKENKIHKARTFNRIDDLYYPSTKAVSDYVRDQLKIFNEEEVQPLTRLMDLKVIENENELPIPDEDTKGSVYIIQNSDGIHNAVAVCKFNGHVYSWEKTLLDTVSKFKSTDFIESKDGLGINIDPLALKIIDDENVKEKIVNAVNEFLRDDEKSFVTREEFNGKNYLTNVKIEPGTQAGTIKYTTVGAKEMSEDVRVTNINNLAFLDKVTEEYIDDNAILPNHISNRAIEHRHLGDKVVAAHNMRAPFMHIFGNFEDELGMTVKTKPIRDLLWLFEDSFVYYMENNNKFKEWQKNQVQREFLRYRLRIRGDYLWMVFPEDSDPDVVDEAIEAYNKFVEEENKYHQQKIDTCASVSVGEDMQDKCTVTELRKGQTIVEFNEFTFDPDDKYNKIKTIEMTCPFAKDGKCTRYESGDQYSQCPAKMYIKNYDNEVTEYNVFNDLTQCEEDVDPGVIIIGIELSEELLNKTNTDDGRIRYRFMIDWFGDDEVMQHIDIYIDPKKIKIK